LVETTAKQAGFNSQSFRKESRISVVSLFVCFPSQTRTNVWKCPAFAPTTLNVLIPEGVTFVAVVRDGLETEKFAKVRWVDNLSFI